MRQYCLVLDLHDDEDLIAQYEHYHQPGNVWPEVIAHLHKSGIEEMRIYRRDMLLAMVLQTDERFSFKKLAEASRRNDKVRKCDTLMDKFQKASESAGTGNWERPNAVFALSEHSVDGERN